MVVDVALYTVVHQPRRLKLPAQPIPRCASVEDITRCLFDERLNERHFRQVAQSCYYPAVRLFLELVQRHHLRLALGISLSFVRQATLWEPGLLDLFRELVAEEQVELIGVEPYRSLHSLIDLPGFTVRMRWMAEEMERLFGKRPSITNMVGEPGISSSIYHALDTAGFQGALIEGHAQMMQWRSSNYLYHPGEAARNTVPGRRTRRGTARNAERDRLVPPYVTGHPAPHHPYLLIRHEGLSADVSARFSDQNWHGFPLYAGTYADWIKRAEGDYILLGWDFETFGERQKEASGIFEFMRTLPDELEQRGITLRTPGELIERLAQEHAYDLSLPLHPTSWSAPYALEAHPEEESQRILLQLMSDVYQLAQLTENPELLDLAIWLCQTDNLHQTRWPDSQPGELPYEWQRFSPASLLHQQKQVYSNLLEALEPYLPIRALRQPAPKKPDTLDLARITELQEPESLKEVKARREPKPLRERKDGPSSQIASNIARPGKRKSAPATKGEHVMAHDG